MVWKEWIEGHEDVHIYQIYYSYSKALTLYESTVRLLEV